MIHLYFNKYLFMCLKTQKKSQNMADNRTPHVVNGNKDTTAQPHVSNIMLPSDPIALQAHSFNYSGSCRSPIRRLRDNTRLRSRFNSSSDLSDIANNLSVISYINLSVISNISMLDHITITPPLAQKIPPSLAKRSIESLVKR